MATIDEPIVIEVAEDISATAEQTWWALTNVPTWREWWPGHRLKLVDPAWQRGAMLVWNQGREAVIFDLKPGELLDFGGKTMGMEIHRYFKVT